MAAGVQDDCLATMVPADPVISSDATSWTKWVWRHADAVCFDVDSTVCQEEAIDELARFCGKADAVTAVTVRAMNGNMNFRDALRERLAIISPSLQQVGEFLLRHPPQLTPGIMELVNTLQARNVDVYLVSGGFSIIISPVAHCLNIPEENVFANVLQFDELGTFCGFDETQFTSFNHGKRMVCQHLIDQCGYKRLVMVGDGATDLEACPPAHAFVGFGGNQVRATVKEKAEWFAYSFDELLEEMNCEGDMEAWNNNY